MQKETKFVITTVKELNKIEKNINDIERYLPIGARLSSIEDAKFAFTLESIKNSIKSIRSAL